MPRPCRGGAAHPWHRFLAKVVPETPADDSGGSVRGLPAAVFPSVLQVPQLHQSAPLIEERPLVKSGVSARCAAGLSGCAPCRLRCHGHSASIPHALRPSAGLRVHGACPIERPARLLVATSNACTYGVSRPFNTTSSSCRTCARSWSASRALSPAYASVNRVSG